MKQNKALEKKLMKLAPPGAGIPFLNRLAFQYIVKPLVARRTPWHVLENRFQILHQKIYDEMKSLDDSSLRTKVLVDPIMGLEDSSRYWSVAMTLEHLVIVGRQIMGVVLTLSHENTPSGKADTAKVKPKGEFSVDQVLRDFENFRTSEFEKMNLAIENRTALKKFSHPWFGEMSVHEWYWLLSAHAAIHYKQIKAIKHGLAGRVRNSETILSETVDFPERVQ